MKKVFSDPEDLQIFSAWGLNVPYKQGVRCGDFVFLSGQTAFDKQSSTGGVLFPGDLARQTRIIMERNAALLDDLGVKLADVVHVASYYVGISDRQESVTVQREFLPPQRVTSTDLAIYHPANLDLAGRVEIEMIAMPNVERRVTRSPIRDGLVGKAPFADGVRADQFIFISAQRALDEQGQIMHPGDKIAQAELAIRKICAIVEELGSSAEHVVKLRTYHVGTDNWDHVLDLESRYFPGPLTGSTIAVTQLADPGALIQIDAIAFLGKAAGVSRSLRPYGHAGSAKLHAGVKCGEVLLIGGQLAIGENDTAVAPGNTIRQIDAVMGNFKLVLDSFGASFDDVVKTNTFYVGDNDDWPGLIQARGKYFKAGPAVTGVRISQLSRPEFNILVEGVALIDDH